MTMKKRRHLLWKGAEVIDLDQESVIFLSNVWAYGRFNGVSWVEDFTIVWGTVIHIVTRWNDYLSELLLLAATFGRETDRNKKTNATSLAQANINRHSHNQMKLQDNEHSEKTDKQISSDGRLRRSRRQINEYMQKCNPNKCVSRSRNE